MKDEVAAWKEEVLVRPANLTPGTERNMIADAWRESFIEADEAGPLPIPFAKEAYWKAIDQWLNGWDGVEVLVAESKTLGELLGFLVTYTTPRHGRALMYVWVKRTCQTKVKERGSLVEVRVKRGVASLLMLHAGFVPGAPYTICFRTADWLRVMRHSRRWKAGVYRPKPAKYAGSNQIEKRAQ